MNAAEIATILEEQFGASIAGKNLEAIDPWIEVRPEAIADVALFLRDDPRLAFDYLSDLCGVDYLEPDPAKAKRAPFSPHVEVVYHLFSTVHRHRLAMKAVLPRWKGQTEGKPPDLPSVSRVWGVANWHERECYDLIGVRFTGHPNLHRILCPEDWVGHPLRKDYEMPLEYHGVRGR